MAKNSYIMSNRVLNTIINLRIEYNKTARKNRILSTIPHCRICGNEIKEGQMVKANNFRSIRHDECIESSMV